MVIIERPRRLLTTPVVDTRLKTVRTQHGERATHWWFFDRDDVLHYDAAGTVKVRPHGKPDTHHKVRPTPVQRQIIQAGAAVCWIAKDTVLIPYGGHPGTYPVLEGEDWSGEMASWSKDWKISHPYPADGAAWWGLVPQQLLALGQHTGFRPAPAFRLMTALENVQHGREAHRRRLAREYAQSQEDHPVTAAADLLPSKCRQTTQRRRMTYRPRWRPRCRRSRWPTRPRRPPRTHRSRRAPPSRRRRHPSPASVPRADGSACDICYRAAGGADRCVVPVRGRAPAPGGVGRPGRPAHAPVGASPGCPASSTVNTLELSRRQGGGGAAGRSGRPSRSGRPLCPTGGGRTVAPTPPHPPQPGRVAARQRPAPQPYRCVYRPTATAPQRGGDQCSVDGAWRAWGKSARQMASWRQRLGACTWPGWLCMRTGRFECLRSGAAAQESFEES